MEGAEKTADSLNSEGVYLGCYCLPLRLGYYHTAQVYACGVLEVEQEPGGLLPDRCHCNLTSNSGIAKEGTGTWYSSLGVQAPPLQNYHYKALFALLFTLFQP